MASTYELSNTTRSITESATLGMAKIARQLKSEGKDIISLSIGEPDFDTPKNICDAAHKASLEGYTHYPPVLGLPEFRKAICEKLKTENNLRYNLNETIVSTGAKHSLINAVMAVVNKGDEVILPAPYWVSYPTMVEYAGAKVVPIETSIENNYKPSVADFEKAITPKTKLIIFSNPTNPSGSVWKKEELEQIAILLEKHPQVLIISDEIYEHINYSGSHCSFASIPGMKERTATVNGLAKGYAMTGWRIGYLAGPEWWVKACEKIQGLFTSAANSVAQMAGIEALLNSQDEIAQMRGIFETRKQLVQEKLGMIEGLKLNNPEGAFYFFPQVDYFFGKKYNGKVIHNAGDLCMYLLQEAEVATVGGEPFGSPKSIRLSYATSEENLSEACRRLKNALDKLID